MSSATTAATAPTLTPQPATDQWYPLRRSAEAVLAPLVALIGAALLFSIFLLFLGASPLDFLDLVWRGAFGSWFSIQNTVQRASPLLLTALCVAIPGQLGLVIIGGEAAVGLGGPAGTVGGVAFVETHFVEGVLRDPSSLNKPSTYGIGDENMLDTVPWLEVHPGLPVGIVACVLCWVLIYRTSTGFASRVTGGNIRAAELQGLPGTKMILLACAIGGGCARLAGASEVGGGHGGA